jgi:hypothetical protein
MTRELRPIHTISLALCAAAITISGCASSGAGSTAQASTGAAAHPAAARDHSLITAGEMQGLNTVNLFEVVQRLHPEWLVQRNSSTPGKSKGLTMSTDNDVSVYIGDQRVGNSQFLRSMTMGSASSLKYFNSSESQVRFGTNNLNGVIQVITN